MRSGGANSLLWSDEQQTYRVMFRWLDALVELDTEGEVLWQLGGAHSDFEGDPEQPFDRPHISWADDDTLWVFDNADHTVGVSGPIELQLDPEQRTHERTFEHRDPNGTLERVPGDVVPLPDCEHVLVAWSTSGRVEELTRDGEVVWAAQTDPGWLVPA